MNDIPFGFAEPSVEGFDTSICIPTISFGSVEIGMTL
jgi:hypothetical protein